MNIKIKEKIIIISVIAEDGLKKSRNVQLNKNQEVLQETTYSKTLRSYNSGYSHAQIFLIFN